MGENLWVADGLIVRMAYLGASIPFPTHMAVLRLLNGGLFLQSPTEPDEGLRSEIDALGPLRHLVSPNKIHYAHMAAWKWAYPGATVWASPGVRERAASQGAEVSFDADLGDGPEGAWSEDLDQLVFQGSRFMEEAFFHRGTSTLVLADLIENFEPGKVGGSWRWLVRLAGAADPDGKAPMDLRLTFSGGKEAAQASFERIVAWGPERVIVAHGRWYDRDGTTELRRAFRWLGPAQVAAAKGAYPNFLEPPQPEVPGPPFLHVAPGEALEFRPAPPRPSAPDSAALGTTAPATGCF